MITLHSLSLGSRQAVRHKTLTLVCVGSNPAFPAIVLIGPLSNAQINEPFDALTAVGKTAAVRAPYKRGTRGGVKPPHLSECSSVW